MQHASGTLWVVATPIGNLGDLSPRAVETLRAVQAICAEDTRHTRPLLQQFGIDTPLLALHDHNEANLSERLVARLLAGESLALVSDAGTPLVSDPGYRLVAAAHEAGIAVSPVPGPCAAIAALSAAGLASDRFVFEGFLPAKSGARRSRIEALAAEIMEKSAPPTITLPPIGPRNISAALPMAASLYSLRLAPTMEMMTSV